MPYFHFSKAQNFPLVRHVPCDTVYMMINDSCFAEGMGGQKPGDCERCQEGQAWRCLAFAPFVF